MAARHSCFSEAALSSPLVQKKVTLLGDFSIGKTSLVRQFVYHLFDERYMSTLGVNITRKTVDTPDQNQVRLLIWDLSGNEKFDGARTDYVRGSAGAMLVCDLSRPETIERLRFFNHLLHASCPQAPVIMVGNKVDLVQADCEAIQQVKAIANEYNAPYKITSAKTGEAVEAAFSLLAQLMVSPHE